MARLLIKCLKIPDQKSVDRNIKGRTIRYYAVHDLDLLEISFFGKSHYIEWDMNR